MDDGILLSVRRLSLTLPTESGRAQALNDVTFDVPRGSVFALVGESGCGKSLTASAIMRLLPEGARVPRGEILLEGTDLLALTENEMRAVRGGRAAMIFQEPAAALDPVMTAGGQIAEMILAHSRVTKKEAEEEAVRWIGRVGLPDPEKTARKYPHELSGGQKQRVMIASALSAGPSLLIADEPTTALDVTVQAQILDLLDELRAKRDLTVLLITHDLAVVKARADRLALMYAGETLEEADAADFFAAPAHPYAKALLRALPKAGRSETLIPIEGTVPSIEKPVKGCRFAPRCPIARASCTAEDPALVEIAPRHLCRCPHREALPGAAQKAEGSVPSGGEPLLRIENLTVDYRSRGFFAKKHAFRAVDGVSFTIAQGETLALVGESGSGKTTAAMAALALLGDAAEVSGRIELAGEQILPATPEGTAHLRKSAQIIFQDPYSSLDPRMSILETLTEGMKSLRPELGEKERTEKALALLEAVGLPREAAGRLPHAFSGGQRQRVAIARALSAEPKLIVCDEPTSALDVSVQAQILNLLNRLQRRFGLSYLFITHNFAVVEHMADRIAVMRRGRIVEEGTAAEVLGAPKDPYTVRLLESVPRL
jgi:peptide/nickel transport system ATP-binding protein